MTQNVRKNSWLIFETILVFIMMSLVAVWLDRSVQPSVLKWFLYVPLLIFQGFWFYRLFIVGHEASHKKLFKGHQGCNDLIGTIMLLPLLTPINIFRKIHMFHHGYNRRDHKHSALDTFVVKGKPSAVKTVYYYVIWYVSVFMGGFFIHSLISVLLFLWMPPKIAQKISPAFKGWSYKDQAKAILIFMMGVLLHVMIAWHFGWKVYALVLGWPMLAFAWMMSMIGYALHYDTSKGNSVKLNVRSVKRIPVISWVMMNFHEHATHHQSPSVPWYDLSSQRKDLPRDYEEQNQTTWNFFRAIFNQLKGPVIVYEDEN